MPIHVYIDFGSCCNHRTLEIRSANSIFFFLEDQNLFFLSTFCYIFQSVITVASVLIKNNFLLLSQLCLKLW